MPNPETRPLKKHAHDKNTPRDKTNPPAVPLQLKNVPIRKPSETQNMPMRKNAPRLPTQTNNHATSEPHTHVMLTKINSHWKTCAPNTIMPTCMCMQWHKHAHDTNKPRTREEEGKHEESRWRVETHTIPQKKACGTLRKINSHWKEKTLRDYRSKPTIIQLVNHIRT